ncbi:hypothetical protein KAW18_16495 [candidate division WOR-3 bacterium]|nr:hypothetical protein [candidate division WOR-3 bacterium]
MAQSGFVLPLNDVVQGDYLTERLEVGPAATVAKMLPGRHVVYDGTDYGVKEGGAAGSVIGIIGYGEANADYKPATRDTAYTARGDEIPIHNGAFRARVYVTEAVGKGDPLVAAADGKFDKYDSATFVASSHVLGHAAETIADAGQIWAVMSI